ncbi:MAG: outer membrane beta-barrel protein [Balneolales bacterium]|nr:outer membrane beta-barrel protein [Balneolales bacterium]
MRTFTLKAILLSVIMFGAGFLAELNAQEQVRRFSISLHGGVSFATQDLRVRPSGGFGANVETPIVFGGSLQYSLTPMWSLEGYVQYQQFEDDGTNEFNNQIVNFESTVIHTSLRSIVHLNQLFASNRLSNYIGPYAFVGAGYNFYDYETNRPDVSNSSGTALNGVLGAGVNIYLTRTVDLFGQYEFIATNNSVSARSGRSVATYANVVGGLRFHFGPSQARHISWRRAPMDIYEEDYNRIMGLGDRMDELERRMAGQDNEIKRLEQEILTKTRQLEGRATQLETRTTNLENQFAELQQSVRDSERERDRRTTASVDETGLTQNLPDGHYVQVFAGLTMESAQRARRMAIESLNGVVDNPSSMVLITQRRQFYEVRIGVFERFPDTVNVLRTAQGTFSDAFVVTFPRPAHLREFYQDMRSRD